MTAYFWSECKAELSDDYSIVESHSSLRCVAVTSAPMSPDCAVMIGRSGTPKGCQWRKFGACETIFGSGLQDFSKRKLRAMSKAPVRAPSIRARSMGVGTR